MWRIHVVEAANFSLVGSLAVLLEYDHQFL